MRYGFKGFDRNLKAHFGGFQYELGKWNIDGNKKIAQCHSQGLHCADNPLDCISNGYSWDGNNRFFKVALDGDVHQDDHYDTQLAATRMYLVKELNLKEFVFYAMNFIQEHKYTKLHNLINLNYVIGSAKPFEIVYGYNPMAVGSEGQVIGLIKVDNEKNVVAMNIIEIGIDEGFEAGTCYDVYGNPVSPETINNTRKDDLKIVLSGNY